MRQTLLRKECLSYHLVYSSFLSKPKRQTHQNKQQRKESPSSSSASLLPPELSKSQSFISVIQNTYNRYPFFLNPTNSHFLSVSISLVISPAMPSRLFSAAPPPSTVFIDPLPPTPSPSQVRHQNYSSRHFLFSPVLASTACSVFLLFFLCCRKLTKKRTTPSSDSDSRPPYRYSYSVLRRATSSFSTRLGHGGFGPVFSGSLPSTHQPIAVKLMDSTSLQGEREFHNELFFASRLQSQHVVSAIGFSSDTKRRRFLLVYELMQNGNLQDALLQRKCPELMDWKKRFAVVVDIAKGIHYLHSFDPPVIHSDIKPSNILLDRYFSAKIGDFGLARLKSEIQCEVGVLGVDKGKMNGELGLETNKKDELESNDGVTVVDCGSVVEETESVNTCYEELSVGLEQSPEGFVRVPILETSPETIEVMTASPGTAFGAVALPFEGNCDRASFENERTTDGVVKKNDKGLKSSSGKDLPSKQDNGSMVAPENTKVKDYVMEWIGTEVEKERPKSNWIGGTSSSGTGMVKPEKKKNRKRLEWWWSMDVERNAKNLKKDKRRPAREWWKEEYCEELARKKKKKKKREQKKGNRSDDNGDDWWAREDDLYMEKKKKPRSQSWSTHGSKDWWLNGLSGELWRARQNSYDSGSGEVPKSVGTSSTPSMRGTVCYVAPEYGYGEDVSEKWDVYSFGVLLLVIIAGRRPLQVTSSPLSEFQKANLLSWARHCARSGKLLDLVDQSIQSLNREQALLCITVALQCLQKSPARRPSMKEVVGILIGELEPPQLPVEFSPSPPSRFPYKSRKKVLPVFGQGQHTENFLVCCADGLEEGLLNFQLLRIYRCCYNSYGREWWLSVGWSKTRRADKKQQTITKHLFHGTWLTKF
ncbi:Receptor-like serine/threonine-protein kinase [Quillaja saponaria]|uniref:Receptor-like serine/threonine-protein kinase n=1 Tax=Quillaja saponaria TaxID=32244 RepID=A0AAD7M5A7_QUISA|nr:Receptor-like serine/threonine-protein kinase [Quillaja saponaria]